MRIADWTRETFIAERNYKPFPVEVVTYPGGVGFLVGSTVFRFSRRSDGAWDLECQGDIDNDIDHDILPRKRA